MTMLRFAYSFLKAIIPYAIGLSMLLSVRLLLSYIGQELT